MFLKYCVFSLRFYDFLNSASSAAALVFYLPGVCTHRHRGKTEKGQSPDYFKVFEKNTMFNEHPVFIYGTHLAGMNAVINTQFITLKKQQKK